MDDDQTPANPDRRMIEDRRSGIDTRSEAEKQLIGERRVGADRRSERTIQPSVRPPNEQLALFARRLRRALGNERARDFFGVTRGEYDFAIYPDVLRAIEWIESLAASGSEEVGQAASQVKATLKKSALPY